MKKLITLLLFFTVTSFAVENNTDTSATSTQTSGSSLIGGEFNLINQDGVSVTDKDYHGKYSLVFFGFTHCPYVCPLGLQRMMAALSKIDNFSIKITPIFITVDPERDTPERLTSYLTGFNKSLVGLTGSEDELAKTAKAYRVYYYKSVDEKSGSVNFDHSSIIYLMDKQGKYVTHFSNESAISDMAEKINNVINSNK